MSHFQISTGRIAMKYLLIVIMLLFTTLAAEQIPSNKKTILVVGGAGFIGSHINKLLHQFGYETIVLDNLSKGNRKAVTRGLFIQGDLADNACLDQIFQNHPIDAVMHFAAYIDVGESVTNPAAYYTNNVANTMNLLNAMLKHSVKYIIFSSTAAIFGNPIELPVKETHPCMPLNPYGKTKLMIEHMLQDYGYAYGIKFCCLRYFNAAGGDPEGEIKNFKRKESNLIPVALRSLKNGTPITIFGTDYPTMDGTCIRDYIHILDLGSAHILAMEHLLSGKESAFYNLGNGKGFSVLEVLNTVEKVTGKPLNIMMGPRREGDSPCLIADSKKAELELGWKPQYTSLEIMIEHAWKALH